MIIRELHEFSIIHLLFLIILQLDLPDIRENCYFGLIAVRAGMIRLIDNIEFPPAVNQKG